MNKGRQRITFAVPAGAGSYAPEVLYCSPDGTAAGCIRADAAVLDLSVLVESLPASAAIEVDLLKPGGNYATAGDWISAAKSYTLAALQDLVSLGAWVGVRIRAKSGGTSGNAVVSASWD